MPRYVDHEQRRAHVTAVAADLVARRGIDALTVRGVAEAAGFSTTVVSHYFDNKRDLLLATYRAAAARSVVHVDAAVDAGGGLSEALRAVLPVDEQRRLNWTLLITLWGVAATDPQLADEQREAVRAFRHRIERLVAAAQAGSEGWSTAKFALAARRLASVVIGMSVQTIFHPRDWDARRLEEVLQDEIDSVLSRGDGVGSQPAAKLAGSA